MEDAPFDHAASHLGKAVGMANLLRGTAYHAARCALPDDRQKTLSQATSFALSHSSSKECCLCLPLCSSRSCMSCVGCWSNAGPTATASNECMGRLCLGALQSGSLMTSPALPMHKGSSRISYQKVRTALQIQANHILCRRRSYLPQDLCVREGVADEDVLRGQNSEHVSNVAFEVAKQAKVPQKAPCQVLHPPCS